MYSRLKVLFSVTSRVLSSGASVGQVRVLKTKNHPTQCPVGAHCFAMRVVRTHNLRDQGAERQENRGVQTGYSGTTSTNFLHMLAFFTNYLLYLCIFNKNGISANMAFNAKIAFLAPYMGRSAPQRLNISVAKQPFRHSKLKA